MFTERPGLRVFGLRGYHGRLPVVLAEWCTHGAIALYFDVGSERVEVVKQVIDLLLERAYMR